MEELFEHPNRIVMAVGVLVEGCEHVVVRTCVLRPLGAVLQQGDCFVDAPLLVEQRSEILLCALGVVPRPDCLPEELLRPTEIEIDELCAPCTRIRSISPGQSCSATEPLPDVLLDLPFQPEGGFIGRVVAEGTANFMHRFRGLADPEQSSSSLEEGVTVQQWAYPDRAFVLVAANPWEKLELDGTERSPSSIEQCIAQVSVVDVADTKIIVVACGGIDEPELLVAERHDAAGGHIGGFRRANGPALPCPESAQEVDRIAALQQQAPPRGKCCSRMHPSSRAEGRTRWA